MTDVVLGVDVAASRGCDVVALGPDGIARPAGRVHTGAGLRALLAEHDPAVVAIDAPPAWAAAGRRACERALAERGISVFTTPDAGRGEANPFYAWMRTGFVMFVAARDHTTLETYPHAVAVALHGAPPARGLMGRPAEKRAWRRAALERAGVDHGRLRTIDEIDAALCALTARRHLEGRTVALGDPEEGVMTLPDSLPGPPPGRAGPVRRRGTR